MNTTHAFPGDRGAFDGPISLTILALLLGTALGCLVPRSLGAQPLGQTNPTWVVGGSIEATLLVGSSSDFLSGNFGFGVHVARKLSPPLALRFDASLLDLDESGSRRERAENRLLTLTAGPEAELSFGPVGLYGRVVVGAVANFMDGAREGANGTDWSTGIGGAAGLRFDVGGGVTIHAEAGLLETRNLEFARSSMALPTARRDVTALSLRSGLAFSLR